VKLGKYASQKPPFWSLRAPQKNKNKNQRKFKENSNKFK